ncbi:MAG: hypothetical protein LBE20_00845 [Deltaproteobacteria bacterium]|jgi:hypothetical protein|nr:hypothetical protein [Deltaproteobacteria bacterium]
MCKSIRNKVTPYQCSVSSAAFNLFEVSFMPSLERNVATVFYNNWLALPVVKQSQNLFEFLNNLKVVRTSEKCKVQEYVLAEFVSEIYLKMEDAGNNYVLKFKLLFDASRSTPKTSEIVKTLLGLKPDEYFIKKLACVF